MSEKEISDIRETLRYYETTQTEPTYCNELITTGALKQLLEEIERLNNIINELENWLKEESEKLHNIAGDNFTTVGQAVYEETLNKLQELKGRYRNV